MKSSAANVVQLSDHQVIAALRDSPVAKEAAAKLAAELLNERKGHVAAISELERVAGASFADGQVALAAAVERLRAAEAALQAARVELGRVRAETACASLGHGAERDRLEASLRQSSIPAVGEFIKWLWGEQDVARNSQVVSDVRTTKSALTGRPVTTGGTNHEEIQARMRAIRETIEKAEALYLIADQADVPRQIEELRKALPKIS
jgi:hypothetical protein